MENINIHFEKEGGSSAYSYSLTDCQSESQITFEYVDQSSSSWLHKTTAATAQGNIITIAADPAGSDVTQGRRGNISVMFEGNPCRYFVVTQSKGQTCDCNYIQAVSDFVNLPSSGVTTDFVIGTITVTDGSCSVTFSSTTAGLEVVTAATDSNNTLSVIVKKAPTNEIPDVDTPSRTLNITTIVNEHNCGTYGIVQLGTILCDCDHIKIDPADVNTKLPPAAINDIFLLSADTKGCGEIIFECKSEMFVDSNPRVEHDEHNHNIIKVYANINELPSNKDERSGAVAYTYVLNGTQDTDKCTDELEFIQTKNYCGCQYDFEVEGYYVPSYSPRYMVRPYFFDKSMYADYVKYTIPPKFYDYCRYKREGESLSNGEYCDMTETVVIASLVDQWYRSLDDCRSFSVTVGDDTDWITIKDPYDGGQVDMYGYVMLQLAKIEDNPSEDEDRTGTIIIHRYTDDDGECNPVEVKILQRHKISSCYELFEALDGYYDTFRPQDLVHESIKSIFIEDIYVPYGELILEYDEEKLNLNYISYNGYYWNANYLRAYLSLKDGISRDSPVTTDVTIKIKLSDDEICEVYSYTITWQKKSTPVERPCDCYNIELSYHDYVTIPYNFNTGCTYCEVFGYNNASHPSDCGEISGYTSDADGNYVDPETYDWFTITEYGNGRSCNSWLSGYYAVWLRLNYIPTENKIGYFKPFLVKDGERRLDLDCGSAITVNYIADCSTSVCDDVYKTGNDNISLNLYATHNDVGKTYDVGYIEIELKNKNCYTYAGIECGNCISGYIYSTHTEFIKDVNAEITNVDGTYRMEYSFKFGIEPNQPIRIPIDINLYIAGVKQYEEHIKVHLNYTNQ